MRLNQQEGAEKLIELVARNAPHSAYMDAVDYAKFWQSIVSGLNQDEIIVSYKPRETPEQKAQRVRLYVSPTKTCSQRASVNMARLRTSDAPQENISYQSETNENDAILAALLSRFNGDRDLKKYLFDTQEQYVKQDPHAFLVVLFDAERDQSGAFAQKPRPRPEIVPCSQVYDFGFSNGEYHWLCRFRENPGTKGSWRQYTLYTPDFVHEAYQTENNPNEYRNAQYIEFKQGERMVSYYVQTFPISSQRQLQSARYEVPFAPLGYKFSSLNEGRPMLSKERSDIYAPVYQSIFDGAENKFRELISRSSEYALTIALHVFMQKYQYVKKCDNIIKGEGMCEDGTMSVSKRKCTVCGGTGKKVMTTVQDTVTITLPDSGEEFFPIRDLVTYVEMPFEIVNHLQTEIRQLESDIETAIWGIDLRKKPDGQMTATEVLGRYDTVYVVLSEMEQHYARLWEKCVRLTAKYAEIDEGLSVSYNIRNRYEMETVEELTAAVKMAKDAGLSPAIIRAYEKAIIKKQGQMTETEIQWEAAMYRFKPFKSKSATDIAFILSDLPENDEIRVLWTYFDEIFEEIREQEPAFPLYPVTGEGRTQRSVLAAKIIEYQARIVTVSAEMPGAVLGRGDRALDVQRLALAAMRASDAGQTDLAAKINAAIDKLTDQISAE